MKKLNTFGVEEVFYTVSHVLIRLNGLYCAKHKSRWVEDTSYGHRGRGYYTRGPSEKVLDEIYADVLGMVGGLDGCAPITYEDLQICFSMLVEKYKLDPTLR